MWVQTLKFCQVCLQLHPHFAQVAAHAVEHVVSAADKLCSLKPLSPRLQKPEAISSEGLLKAAIKLAPSLMQHGHLTSLQNQKRFHGVSSTAVSKAVATYYNSCRCLAGCLSESAAERKHLQPL